MIEMLKKIKVLLAVLILGIGSLVVVGEAWAEVPSSIARQPDVGEEAAQRINDKMSQIKDEVAKGHDWQTQSVDNKGNVKEESKDEEKPQGSATSGNVETYVGTDYLTGAYYNGCNSSNIFNQLACRAGMVGSGLRSVGYIIAGFGLLVFSFAALFGKVKWNVFATIMFSVFLLSMTFYVINTFTAHGNAGWIAGIAPTGYNSAEQVYAPTQNVDAVSVPDAENEEPK